MSSSGVEDMSFREAQSIQNPPSSSRKAGRGTGCEGVVSCLMGKGKRPSLPVPKRPAVPVSHNQYELRECFPCVYNPLHFFVLDRLPFLRWLLRYNVRWLVSDIVAGLTVGLMVVPQALAYAKIANLHLRFGLYTAFMGCFIYTFLGTSKDITLGPTAILSLLTASLTESCNPHPSDPYCDSCVPCAVTLTLYTGLVQFLLGIFSLGFLVEFIPLPIISGFTSAAAITIAVGQIASLIGITHTVRRTFYFTVYDIFHYITEVKPGDIVFGFICISLVVFLKYLKVHTEKLKESRTQSWASRAAFKFLWFICTARNAVVVVIGALIGYTLTTQVWFNEELTLIHTGHFSLPPLRPPNITIQSTKEVAVGIAVAPFISFLESIAIAKAFARKEGYKVNPSQELVAIGIANVASSFISSYPVTGSFSRTAVNNQSGVRTPAAGIITGTVVLLAIAFLSSFFDYIPKTSLAAIIIAAVLPMVDVRILWKIFKIRALDDLPLIAAFLFTLFLGIEYGVPIAVVIYACILLYRKARPRHEIKIIGSIVCVVFNGGWNYPAVEYIWQRVFSEITSVTDKDREKTEVVVMDCRDMPEIDYSIVQAMRDECEELRKMEILCVLVNCQPQVEHIVEQAGIKNLLLRRTLEEALELTQGQLPCIGRELSSTFGSTSATGSSKYSVTNTITVTDKPQ